MTESVAPNTKVALMRDFSLGYFPVVPTQLNHTLIHNLISKICPMDKPQGIEEKLTSKIAALLTPIELSALTGISTRAILNAATRGNCYFRSWLRSEEGTWDFEVVNPNSKKPRRRFYRVE